MLDAYCHASSLTTFRACGRTEQDTSHGARCRRARDSRRKAGRETRCPGAARLCGGRMWRGGRGHRRRWSAVSAMWRTTPGGRAASAASPGPRTGQTRCLPGLCASGSRCWSFELVKHLMKGNYTAITGRDFPLMEMRCKRGIHAVCPIPLTDMRDHAAILLCM